MSDPVACYKMSRRVEPDNKESGKQDIIGLIDEKLEKLTADADKHVESMCQLYK